MIASQPAAIAAAERDLVDQAEPAAVGQLDVQQHDVDVGLGQDRVGLGQVVRLDQLRAAQRRVAGAGEGVSSPVAENSW
jgi:hypothetical protein